MRYANLGVSIFREEAAGLCRNARLAYSFVLFELNPQTKTLHYSRISTSLPTTLHLASPSTMIQLIELNH